MTSCVAVVCFLLALTVTVHAQDEVDCFAGPGFVCDLNVGVRTATIDDCCTHSEENPHSFVYMIPGVEGCIACPTRFGFTTPKFSGIEQGENHVVQLGFLSGSFNGFFTIGIALERGTAGVSDVSLTTTSITFFSGALLLQPVSFILRVDGVAQEFVETFKLSITGRPPVAVTSRTLEGNIVDGDRISFTLSEDDYRKIEGEDAPFEVRVAKNGDVLLANPVTFRITPLTADEAFRKNIISSLEPSDPNSPNRANEADFNTTVITGVFPADESLTTPLYDVLVPISFEDDLTDEADKQYFIVFLEILNATNIALLENTERNTSRCIIVDNDFVRIGFSQQIYQFTEPDFGRFFFNEVTLILETPIPSEQTFLVGITVSDPPGGRAATLLSSETESYDYNINGAGVTFNALSFPAGSLSISYNFFLNDDSFSEGTESFAASSTPVQGNPIFLPPTRAGIAFSNTEIQILDNDFVVVGFELTKYSVSETAVSQEVCIIVTNPPPTEQLAFNVLLTYGTAIGTADEEDFTPIVGGFRAFLTNTPSRRTCFDVFITDDDSLEDVESFSFDLRLALADPGIIVQPNITEIYILDDDAVWFELRGKVYLNNTVAVLDEVGEGNDALLCFTNNVNCCRSTRRGEFYYPGGSVVPISNRRQDFYRNRDLRFIRLNRRSDARSPSGKYQCKIPDASGAIQNIFITLLVSA